MTSLSDLSLFQKAVLRMLGNNNEVECIRTILGWIDHSNIIAPDLQYVITNHFPQYQKVLDDPDRYRLLL